MATRLGKRPHPKNYATYDPKGKAQYRKDLAEYLKKKAAIEKEKNKLSTKKNIEKQKTSNKKASTAKPKTTAKTKVCLLYTSPSPRDKHRSRMPSSA